LIPFDFGEKSVYATYTLPPGLPKVFMANTVSLFPGTLSVALTDGVLRVHVLDTQACFADEMTQIEFCAARILDLNSSEISDEPV